MSKYYQELENEAQRSSLIDPVIQKLIKHQQDDGFGFPQYWDRFYRFQDFYRDYRDGLIHRILDGHDEELKKLLDQEKQDPNNRLVEDRHLSGNGLQFSARKILWRAFRRIGFQGTKNREAKGAVHDGCLICTENLPDIQKGFRLNDLHGSYSHVVLMNPFPILEDQVTIASLRHEHQELTGKHIRFILDLVERSKVFKYSFNGVDGGASIPDHFHFYGFIGSLPIEKIALAAPIIESNKLSVFQLSPVWSICVFVLTGQKERIVSCLLDLSKQLQSKKLSMNILFTKDEDSGMRVYFIPRKKAGPRSGTGFHRLFGSIEMGGMLICESSREFQNARADRFVEALKQVGLSNTLSSDKEWIDKLIADL